MKGSGEGGGRDGLGTARARGEAAAGGGGDGIPVAAGRGGGGRSARTPAIALRAPLGALPSLAALALLAALVDLACPSPAPAADGEPLEPVVVTATRIEEKASEQASSVSVVTREEIDLKDPELAGDAMRDLPGVVVQRSGSPGNRENIRIRGSQATQTLVLIDGFPVNSPTLGQFDLGSLPAAPFERIEVVRGAQSALYGSNAMGGVVNFIPLRGDPGTAFGGAAGGGSDDTLRLGAFAQGRGKRGGGHAGVAAFDTGGALPHDGTTVLSALLAGDRATGSIGRVHGIFLSTDSEKEIPVDFGTPADANHELSRRGLLAGVRWESAPLGPVSLAVSGSVFDEFFHETDPADPGEAFPFAFDDTTKTRKGTAGLQARYAPGTRSVTFAGVEYVRDGGEDVLTSNFGDTTLDAVTRNASVYLQEELRFPGRFGASLGARVDRNSEAGTEFNPKAAAYVDLAGGRARLRGAAGRGFRVPTLAEKGDPFVGNPALAPETVVSGEAGADLRHPGGRGTLSATWFYQDFSDLIRFDGSVPGPAGFGELRNAGHAFSRGIEAFGEARPTDALTVTLDYTWTDTWDPSAGTALAGVPAHRGGVSVALRPSPRWEGLISWRAESDQLDVAPDGTSGVRSGYARVDLSLRRRLPLGGGRRDEAVLTGQVRNLLDRSYEERLGIPAPGIGAFIGVEFRAGDAPGT